MIKYVNYGSQKYGIHMYVITMFRTEYEDYKVEVIPCDTSGNPVSDPVVWDVFPSWWSAHKYVHKQYKEFYHYCNEQC